MRKGAIACMLVLALALTGCGSKEGYAEDGYAEGRMGEVLHTYFFDFTVNSAYVCGELGGYEPAEGSELLVAELTIKNTGRESIPMWGEDFQAQWSDGDGEDDYSMPVKDGGLTDDQLPDEYDLAVDEERTGTLVFEVPAGKSDFSVSYWEYFENDTSGDMFFVYFTADRESDAA